MDNLNHSWFGAVQLTVAIGIAYFLAARLGLVLRSQVGVAIFWPAAGIATGALIALGPAARLPVAIAVAFASIASSLTVNRNPWLAITFDVLDVGDVLLTAWLVQRWFGAVFKLEEMAQVLGFLAASAIGAAVTAAAATIAISSVEPAAIPFNVWRLWFASCSLGLITVAPLLIGLGDALREPPPQRELIEGTIALATLAALSALLISLPQGPWATALPVALAFPVLLWVAVRCRPVFAAVAMFVVTLTVVWSTTFNMGHFGDASIPLADRILAAQTHVLAGALLALVLAALFAERRRNETTLKMSNERLQLAFEREAQLALAGKMGGVGGFTFDIGSGAMQVSPGYAAIHGLPEGTLETTRADWRTRVHPDDLARLDANLQRDVDARRSEHDCEYRIICSTGEMRWIEARSFISYDREGAARRIIGVNIDVTQRKKAELALADLDLQLALAGRAGLVGTFAYDTHHDSDVEKAQISPGYAAIHGLPEGTTEITRSAWLTRVHPEDVERMQGLRNQAFHQRWREYSVDYRIVCAGEVRWIESRVFISYNGDGHPQRVIGVNIDVTERRRTEQVLTDRNRQLELAAKHALVGRYAIEIDGEQEDFSLQRLQFSPGFAAIYGLSEETMEISLGHWRSLVHPDDLPQFVEHRQQLFAERRSDHHAEHRIVRPCGTIRWIEARSFIEYDQAGQAKRMVGVNIDITERKRAEEARKVLNAELDHRVKNALATVTAVVYHTRQGSRSVADFAAALEGRIRSLAATHELLSSRHWQELSLIELVRRELAPYAASRNTEISGPTVLLKPDAGQALAMVLHELATNAAKYGALSTNTGRVLIRWDRRLNGRPLSNLVLEWQEVGGPRVDAPGKSSYGMSTIHDLIPYEFGGTVDLVFAPEGVRCRLELPPDWLINMGEPIEAVADTAL